MSRWRLPLTLLVTTVLAGAFLSASSNETESTQTANTGEELDIVRISEAFGHLIGNNLEAPGFSFDLEGIIRGMRAAANGEASPMSEQEYSQAIAMIQERAFTELANKNLNDAEAFLKENANESGIVCLEQGKLQYRVETEGAGAQVSSASTPLIHYTGRYLDGTIFGTSVDGDPVSLPLDQTIPGFSMGIAGMKQGEKRTLFIHPELGYGTSGHLLPNSLLVFEVEVVQASQESSEPPTS